MFLLGQVSTLACVGTARLSTAFLLLEVSERRGKRWTAVAVALFTCVETGSAVGGCAYDGTTGRFAVSAEVSAASDEIRGGRAALTDGEADPKVVGRDNNRRVSGRVPRYGVDRLVVAWPDTAW